ncbi:hypothetical protein MMC34_007657 [Xylographa carneopallida]|nr:hypothetical protein [Xylographa carneopallida]
MSGPAPTPRRSTRATKGRKAKDDPVPPTEPTTPTTATAPRRKITPRRIAAQRPLAPARESAAYGSPGRSNVSIGLATSNANQLATDVIKAGINTAKTSTISRTSRSKLSTVITQAELDPDSEEENVNVARSPIQSPVRSLVASPAGSPAESQEGSPIQNPVARPVGSPIESPAESEAGSPIQSPVGSPIGSPVGSPEGSQAGSPAQSPVGSPVGSPAVSQPTSPVRVRPQKSGVHITEVQTTQVRLLRTGAGSGGPSGRSGAESDAITGNGTPMGEGYSWNFGTEGPIGRNVGLGSSPTSVTKTFPSGAGRGTGSPRGNGTRPGGGRASQTTNIISRPVGKCDNQLMDIISSPAEAYGSRPTDNTPRPGVEEPSENIIIRPANVGGNPPPYTVPPSATLDRTVRTDSELHTILPDLTEEQLSQAERIRAEALAHELRQRRQESQGFGIWTQSFCSTLAKILVGITLLWVAYNALWAAPAGFRWASHQYHAQTARLKPNGTLFQGNNTSPPGSILRDITTNQYRDIDNRLTTFQKFYNSISVQAPELIGPARVNYFSRGLGATIDPHLTSPTRKLTTRSRSWFGLSSYELRTPDPITALLPWSDIGDCWCAPPSGGRAQLTVILPHKIVPTDLVIEHIPKTATLDIGAAPKDVELWVQIPDVEARARVIDAAVTVPALAEESLLAARTLPVYGADTALDKSWVRVGRWQYDIHAPSHVQSFAVPVELDHFQLAVDKVSVRVRSNWGSRNYACLYRLRMHGLLAERETERKLAESGGGGAGTEKVRVGGSVRE